MVAWRLTGPQKSAPKLATASRTSLQAPPPAGTPPASDPPTSASAAAAATALATAAAPADSRTPCSRPGAVKAKQAGALHGLTAAAQAPLQAVQPPEPPRAAPSSPSKAAREPQASRSSAPHSKPWAWSVPVQRPQPAQHKQPEPSSLTPAPPDVPWRAFHPQQPGPASSARPPQPALQRRAEVASLGAAEPALGPCPLPAARGSCAVDGRAPLAPAAPAQSWQLSTAEPLQQHQDAGQEPGWARLCYSCLHAWSLHGTSCSGCGTLRWSSAGVTSRFMICQNRDLATSGRCPPLATLFC